MWAVVFGLPRRSASEVEEIQVQNRRVGDRNLHHGENHVAVEGGQDRFVALLKLREVWGE
jgi:hypothetical protein